MRRWCGRAAADYAAGERLIGMPDAKQRGVCTGYSFSFIWLGEQWTSFL
ncbi:hypothetical protein B2K_39425 [Paenibacillus mucilaginosus K02]|uniref:Uncharacterized protein n=1 Tax=Paenibacillus mucilaginosus K02 TaxID=997761 RepID=R9ULL6_9BACL|nr:hypothetical protein B2K_39425 [Paenibacillus mucilaginosus K02]